MKRILLITGGKFYDEFAASFLENHIFDEIIAADHGLDAAARLGLPVDILLGDFDSASSESLLTLQNCHHPQVITHPVEKDQTDTELAISCALEQGAEEIVILGGTGSRMDHVMGTIHAMKLALDAGVSCYLADPWNKIQLISEGIRIERSSQYGEYVSLLPFTEKVEGLTLTGMKYPLDRVTLSQGISLGISNEIIDEAAEIVFEQGILIVVESSDKEKYSR